MKSFILVIFVILFAFTLQGNARKVCILYEQKILPSPTILSSESISITQETLEVKEEDSVVNEQSSDLNDISETTEEISIATEEAATEEISDNIEIASKLVNLSVIPSDLQSTNICGLEAITLFDDQNDLLRRMCSITSSPSSLYVVTVQNSIVNTDLSLATLCTEGPKGLLSWIAWQDFIEKVRPLLNTVELPQLVVRNLSIASESENKVDALSEVLIEMLPVRYKLINMTASAWNNITFIKTVSLGNIELENANDTDGHIEGDLSYSFPIEINTTFLSSYPISGLPVEMSDESDGTKNFIVGSTNSYIFNDTFSVERLVPAFKKETVSLKATFGLHEYDIEGKIVSIFGLNTDGTTIEESHTISARVVKSGTYDIKDTYYLEDYTTTTEIIEPTSSEELPIAIPRGPEGAVYPGFRKVFYVACALFFGTMIIAAVDIIRKLRREKKQKVRGRRVYTKVEPKF